MVSQSLELHSVNLRQGSDRSSTSTSMYATKGPAVPGRLFRKVRTVPRGKGRYLYQSEPSGDPVKLSGLSVIESSLFCDAPHPQGWGSDAVAPHYFQGSSW
jgi:hypothetical protein